MKRTNLRRHSPSFCSSCPKPRQSHATLRQSRVEGIPLRHSGSSEAIETTEVTFFPIGCEHTCTVGWCVALASWVISSACTRKPAPSDRAVITIANFQGTVCRRRGRLPAVPWGHSALTAQDSKAAGLISTESSTYRNVEYIDVKELRRWTVRLGQSRGDNSGDGQLWGRKAILGSSSGNAIRIFTK